MAVPVTRTACPDTGQASRGLQLTPSPPGLRRDRRAAFDETAVPGRRLELAVGPADQRLAQAARVEADRIRDESGCVLRYERTFMRPLLPGAS